MARHRPRGLEVRMLTAMALLGLIYAGIGGTLHRLGLPGWAVAALAALVLAGQWFGTERLALAATAAREVGPEQAPAPHQVLERLCALTGQPKPRLAMSPSPEPNAFTVGRSRRHATIVVTEALCRCLEHDPGPPRPQARAGAAVGRPSRCAGGLRRCPPDPAAIAAAPA